jgi:hypothetical protein
MLSTSYMILSDEALNDLLIRIASDECVTLPRQRFAALCIQAMRNGEDDQTRALMSHEQIRELMTDPHNARTVALPADTLGKLCRQGMHTVQPRTARVIRIHAPGRQDRQPSSG